MKILTDMIQVVVLIVGLFGLAFVLVLIEDMIFGKGRQARAKEKMERDLLAGKFQISSKRTGQRVAFLILGATAVSCALFFQPSEVAAREIDTIIVHHTLSGDVSAAEINRWHMQERGWSEIGYHFLIRADGTIEMGRPVSKTGAHAKGRNAHSIGIALTGVDIFTPEQIVSLNKLVEELCFDGKIKKIERHRVGQNACPGTGLDVEVLNKYIRGTQPIASWFMDWNTASGKHVYPWTIGCASWFYPLGTKLRVTNFNTGKSVVCEVIDRGPNKGLVKKGRTIDLTKAAFAKIGDLNEGLLPVIIERVK